MKDSNGLIEIIIPNWNGKELLATCLQSLFLQTSQEFCVTVVDNGSTDGSRLLLHEQFPTVRLLEFSENRGFSAAINEGVRNSRASWILLLNNDIELASDCIETLVQAISSCHEFQFFALRMMSFHDRSVFDGAGDVVLRGGVGYRLGTMEKDIGQYGSDREVFGACAGAALYNIEIFSRIGLFDEDFFAYLEDVDLNIRARRAGFRCRYLAHAVVYHMGSATTGSKINPLTVRLSTKNNLNVLVKNYPLSILGRYLPVILIYQLAWLAFVIKKKQIVAYLQGLGGGLRQFALMIHKRRKIAKSVCISNQKFAQMLASAEQEAVESIMARRQASGKGNMVLKLYQMLFL